MEGHPATSIAKMLGHADLRMTARYAHATDRNLRELVESVGKSCHKIATIQKTAVG
jgi:site-specific recombinase XerD